MLVEFDTTRPHRLHAEWAAARCRRMPCRNGRRTVERAVLEQAGLAETHRIGQGVAPADEKVLLLEVSLPLVAAHIDVAVWGGLDDSARAPAPLLVQPEPEFRAELQSPATWPGTPALDAGTGQPDLAGGVEVLQHQVIALAADPVPGPKVLSEDCRRSPRRSETSRGRWSNTSRRGTL